MKNLPHKYALWLALTMLVICSIFNQTIIFKAKLYSSFIQVDVARHLRTIQYFENLRQQDTVLEQHVLQSRFGLLKNYDPLIASQRQISVTLEALEQENPEYFSGGYTPIHLALKRYHALFQHKFDLIENFKSHNAVLHNSLQYIPVAINYQLTKTPTGSNENKLLHELLENILLYEQNASDSQKDLIQHNIENLLISAKTTDTDLQNLARHVDIVLTRKNDVDSLTRDISQTQTSFQSDKLFKLYGEIFAKKEHLATLFKLALTSVLAFLVAYVVWVLVTLKRARTKLTQSLREVEFQRFALDQHSIVSITDQSGKIIYTNDKFTEISQYDRDELLGLDHRILNSGYHPSEFFKNMWSVIGKGHVWHGEVRNRRKDGTYYWVDSTIVPFMDGDGHPARYVSIRTDITASKTINEQMTQQHLFYERISETLGEGLYVQDTNGKCVYMNAEAEKLLGWTREELIGMQLHDTIHTQTVTGQPLASHDCPILLWVYANGEARLDNQVFVRKDGTVFPVALVSKASYSADGNIESIVVAFQDITARKITEAAALQAKELAEQASKVKSDFLANMSHEIRTPMNGIIGMTDLALDTELNAEQREYIGLVKSSADALLKIINDILDFSKIESGKMDFEIIEFSLDVMLRDTIKTLAVRAHEKQLELLLHVAPDVPDRLMGDPGRLRQVIVNLVGNAIKFTSSGEVEVEVQRVKGGLKGHVKLRFSVRDTGIGIPHEKFQTIFESFSQADTSTTRKYGGTGLGLTISAQIIKLMGSQLELDSKVGIGTTFHFVVDMPMVADSALAQYQNYTQVRGKQILVADDNPTNRKLLQEMLINLQLQPIVVSSGFEALAELERAEVAGQPFTLSILNVHMPDMDGFELAERIRQISQNTCATIMMLTSEGHRGDAAKCRKLGISSYIIKPVLQSDLLDAMMTLLGEHSAQTLPIIARHSLRGGMHKLNLLLAEDNAVNQILGTRLLEKLGHTVTLANNGIEAIEQWRTGHFDAILMDVDMPQMGGYEATRNIRELEALNNEHIIIVAMTAHAMQGAREECLLHGMDGYVSKPIDTEALCQELQSLSVEIKDNQVKNIELFEDNVRFVVADFDKARETMDGNHELFEEIVRLFLAETPPHMQHIRDALNTNHADAIRHSAHAIKGMVGVFAAERTMKAASMVEQYAGQPAELIKAVTELEDSLSELTKVIDAYQWK